MHGITFRNFAAAKQAADDAVDAVDATLVRKMELNMNHFIPR